MSRGLNIIALGTLALFAGPSASNAGGCCQVCAPPCGAPYAPMVAPNAYYYGTQFYVVNEAPSYTGPGVVVLPPNYPYLGGGGCCGGYQPMPYQPVLSAPSVMPYPVEPQGMPEQIEPYEGMPQYAPGPRVHYRHTRWHRPVVYRRHVAERFAPGRDIPFRPTRRRPFNPNDK